MTKTLQTFRAWLFIVLLAAAPFTFNPSLSLPTQGFTSFRLGLYQLLILVFVGLMLPILWQKRKSFFDDKLLSIPLVILAALTISSPFRSLNTQRSILLSASILLLLGFLASGWVFAQTLLTKKVREQAISAIVITSLAVGVFSIIQFMANSFVSSTLGLCAKCGAEVFGFPRINGFASEPQFMASALLPGLFILYTKVLLSKARWSIAGFGFIALVLFMTLSRGGFIAAACGLLAITVILYAAKKLVWGRVALSIVAILAAGITGLAMMGISATIRHPDSPDIGRATVATILEHGSGGVISLPYNDPKPVEQKPGLQAETFQSPGEIKASEEERQSAATYGLVWWGKDMPTMLLGLGSGNLGSYANHQDPTRFSLSFTIYMQYVFMLVEFGVVGLASFLLLCGTAVFRVLRQSLQGKELFVVGLAGTAIGFTVQYLFFGTYINVPYVWLYTGICLAALQFKAKSKV